MTSAYLQGEPSVSIEQIAKPLLQNGSDLSNRRTDNQDCGLRLLRAWTDRFERDLNRLGVLPIKVPQSVVDLGHEDGVPLVHDFGCKGDMGVESDLRFRFVRMPDIRFCN